jgi:hypothetical protein
MPWRMRSWCAELGLDRLSPAVQNVPASKYIRRQAVAEFEECDGTELGIGKS